MNRARLEKRWRELAQRIDAPRPMRSGSISQQRPKRKRADGSVRFGGPYRIYTRKEKGKTVSRLLGEEEAARYRREMESFREFKDLVTEMKQVGLELAGLAEGGSSKKTPGTGGRRKRARSPENAGATGR